MQREAYFINTFAFESTALETVWIGGRNTGTNVTWTDNQVSSFPAPWAPNEPSRDACVLLNVVTSDGALDTTWQERDCGSRRGYSASLHSVDEEGDADEGGMGIAHS